MRLGHRMLTSRCALRGELFTSAQAPPVWVLSRGPPLKSPITWPPFSLKMLHPCSSRGSFVGDGGAALHDGVRGVVLGGVGIQAKRIRVGSPCRLGGVDAHAGVA